MKQKMMKLSALLLLGLGLTGLQAQEVILPSGGNAKGSGGSVSYSVGQIVCSTQTGTNGSIVEGVQQPYEISVVSGVEEEEISLICKAYPNPTSDFLTLKVDTERSRSVSYQIFDISGKLIEARIVTDGETTISMVNLKPAIYLLRVTDNQREVKTFKIVKR